MPNRHLRHVGVCALSACVGRDSQHVYKYLAAHRSMDTLEESHFQLRDRPYLRSSTCSIMPTLSKAKSVQKGALSASSMITRRGGQVPHAQRR